MSTFKTNDQNFESDISSQSVPVLNSNSLDIVQELNFSNRWEHPKSHIDVSLVSRHRSTLFELSIELVVSLDSRHVVPVCFRELTSCDMSESE